MFLQQRIDYTGELIHQRFAYEYLRDLVSPSGDCLVFQGGMDVSVDNMIDLEDVLDNDTIHSDDAINIVWEIPGLTPFGAVCFQRLFNTQIADYLNALGIFDVTFIMDGDDILARNEDNEGGKLSVSITHVQNGVALGHTGLNITAGEEAPDFAWSLNITDRQASIIMGDIDDMFYSLVNGMFVATTKVLV